MAATMSTGIEFTAHNIRLDDGRFTNSALGQPIDEHPWCLSATRILNTVFPTDRSKTRVVDLGCLEGGYSVAIARMGFNVLGVEVRESNMAACRYVKANTNLPNLAFVRDDVWNLKNHGPFDAAFCCGLLYHLDRPKQFLELLATTTSRLLILQTHFATDRKNEKFHLSDVVMNEGLPGRWYTEFADNHSYENREAAKWASWGNRRSFWPKREYLLQAIHDAGFDLVAEQFDGLGDSIADSMTTGYYWTDDRGTFIGVKTRG